MTRDQPAIGRRLAVVLLAASVALCAGGVLLVRGRDRSAPARALLPPAPADAGAPALAPDLAPPGAEAPDDAPRRAAAAPDSSPAEPPAPPDARPGLAIHRVLYRDESPVEDAVLVAVARGEVIREARVAADGTARFEAFDQPAEGAVVLGTTLLFHTPALDGSAGERTLWIGGAERVAGRVTIEGEPPPEPLLLRLTADGDAGGWSVPPPVLRSHLGLRGGWRSVVARTGADGAFDVPGLDPGWSGTLHVPLGTTLADGSQSLALPAPDPELRIDLVREPSARLRIVDAAGAPVPDARTLYEATCEAGAESDLLVSDAEGLVRIPLRCGERFHLSVEAFAPGKGYGARDFDRIERPARGESADLGDLPLEPAGELRLLVTTPDGAPIQGARARPRPGAALLARATDAQGRAKLPAPADLREVRLDALGYAGLSLAPPFQPEVHATLAPAANLALEVDGAAARSIASVEVVLHGDLFASEGGTKPDPTQIELGAASPFRSASRRSEGVLLEASLQFRIPKDAPIRITLLRPGATVTIRALDPSGAAIGDAIEVVVPEVGWRTVRVR